MASIIPGYNYDIFISYRQKDNKHDGWVTELVNHLKGELEATFKEDISIYFDENPHDGLLENHDVDASLKEKLKCLIFIPIISRTYCDPKSFAWEHEFKAFVEQASQDQFGLKVKLPNGNVANRVLPVRIHDLDIADIRLCEDIIGGAVRGIEFIYEEPGVNRSLTPDDDENKNLKKTRYRNQINKVALAINEIVQGLETEPEWQKFEKRIEEEEFSQTEMLVEKENDAEGIIRSRKIPRRLLLGTFALALMTAGLIFAWPRLIKRDTLQEIRASGERITVAVMPFQNMSNDTTWDVWQDGIQDILITSLSNSEELKVRHRESVASIFQSKGLTNYASITPSVASNISQKLDANVFICGSIKQENTLIRINAQLIDSKTEAVFRSFQIDGQAENIMPIIDTLSWKIKDYLIISNLRNDLSHEFQHLASTSSPDAYRYFIYGNNAFNNRDWSTAISFFQQALDIDPDFIFSSFMLAFAYSIDGKTEQTKKIVLQNHMKRDKISLRSMKILADYQYAFFFETPLEQIKYLKQSLQSDDQQPFNNYDLGIAYVAIMQYDNAIPEFEKALGIYEKWGVKPAWVFFYSDLGIAYHKTGQYEKEEKLYKKAEQDFPHDNVLICRQATLSLSLGDTVAANSYIRNYISQSKKRSASDGVIANMLARIYEEAGILNKAEKYYRQALSFEPDSPDRINSLAYFLIDKDQNVNEGLELADKTLNLNPEAYNYLNTKGWGLYKQGRYEEAMKLLEKSWELKPIYDHEVFLHLEAAKKAVEGQKKIN
jgi:TolB-like protein/tetratricopeptide (TPR) repeat protein